MNPTWVATKEHFSFRFRLKWAIFLATLATSMIVANALVPVIDRSQFDCSLDQSGEKVIVEQCHYGDRSGDLEYWGFIRHFELDLNSRKLSSWSQEQSIRQVLLFSRPPLSKSDEATLKNFKYSNLQLKRKQIRVGSALVADRYFLGPSGTGLLAFDLRDPQLRQIEFAVQESAWIPDQPYAIPKSHHFLATSINTASPSQMRVDLVSIQEDRLEIIASWIAARGKADSVATGDQIVSLSVDGKKLEYRDNVDGRLLDTFELPETFDVAKSTWFFDFHMFVADLSANERMRVDLRSKTTLAPSAGKREIAIGTYVPSNHSLLNYFDINALDGMLVHKETGHQVMAYQVARTPDSFVNSFRDNASPVLIAGDSSPIVLDDHRLFIPNHAFGISADIVEIPSGKLLTRVVPLWWVPGFVVVMVCCYVLGVFGWIRASLLDGGWAWLDALLVAAVPVVPLSIRAFAGDTFDLHRTPHLIVQGVCAAGLTLTGIWLVFGKTRWILRWLPFLLVISLVIALRSAVLYERPLQVWRSLGLIVVPVVYAFLVFSVAKFFGCKLKRISSHNAEGRLQEVSASTVGTWGLFETMLVVAAFAVLFAALRPLFPTMAALASDRWLERRTLLEACILLIIAAALMSRGRMICRIAVCAVLLTSGTILANELVLFICGVEFSRYVFHVLTLAGFTPSIGATCMILLLIPYRLRGWRIGWA